MFARDVQIFSGLLLALALVLSTSVQLMVVPSTRVFRVTDETVLLYAIF